MNIKTQDFIKKLVNPQVYTGREINAIRKDPAKQKDLIRVCLVFPDKYEIGMSHYGLIILYHLLNRMENVAAERCFLPNKESIGIFKQQNMPLFSLESKLPLKEFDIIGISLLSEMNFTNVLQVLDLAQVPLLGSERNHRFPLVAAGGISAVNPEPLRRFIDVFAIGDGESLFPDIISEVAAAKEKKMTRTDLLKQLDRVKSLYVPSLYPPVKKGRFFTPDLPQGKIKKRVYHQLDKLPEQDRVIVPITNVVFNRLNVEIARGCPQNCRFCQAKSYYAPYRTRSLEHNIRHISEGITQTGFEAFSLSTLSTGDYPQLDPLLQLIPDIIKLTPGVSFSLSSMRPSTLSDRLLATIAQYKRTGITIVPEAGTQRLRNVLNKDVSDDEIFQAVDMALRNRWQKIKVYFMLGLPTETMEDIDGIVQMIRKMVDMSRAAKQKIKIHASFSPFVPKPQTPLQWAAREPLEKLIEKTRYIKEELRPILRTLDLDFHEPRNSIVETVMARGDDRVGDLLLNAFHKGQIFSAWDHDFDYETWAEMIFDPENSYREFLEEIPTDQTLPWDFLEVNFTAGYMREEYAKALSAEATPSCSRMTCSDCNGCTYMMKRLAQESPDLLEQKVEALRKEIASAREKTDHINFRKIRVIYEKTGDFALFSQLTLNQYLERLIRRAGITFKCSKGFTPRIRMASLPALSVFAQSRSEVVELFVDDTLSRETLLEMLNKSGAPEGFHFKDVLVDIGSRSLSKDIRYIGYEIELENPAQYREAIAPHLEETDTIAYSENKMELTIDHSIRGQERFAKIYKTIDPEKTATANLTRTFVKFKE